MKSWGQIVFMIFLLIFCVSCSSVETATNIEVYSTEILEENAEGIFEVVGYKKVNALTVIESSDNHIDTVIKAIEDHYDLDGNYLKTEVLFSLFNKSMVTRVEDDREHIEELNKPTAILIPDEELMDIRIKELTVKEKERVEKHILSLWEGSKGKQ